MKNGIPRIDPLKSVAPGRLGGPRRTCWGSGPEIPDLLRSFPARGLAGVDDRGEPWRGICKKITKWENWPRGLTPWARVSEMEKALKMALRTDLFWWKIAPNMLRESVKIKKATYTAAYRRGQIWWTICGPFITPPRKICVQLWFWRGKSKPDESVAENLFIHL